MCNNTRCTPTIPCAVQDCIRSFQTYRAFKSHVSRDDENSREDRYKTLDIDETVVMQCPFAFCTYVVQNVNDLLQHLEGHIIQGSEVTCPFLRSGLIFRVKSSFSSQITSCHKSSSNRQLWADLFITSGSYPTVSNHDMLNKQDTDLPSDTLPDSLDHSTCEDINNDDENTVDENLREMFLNNLALFLIKIQCQVPHAFFYSTNGAPRNAVNA